LIIKDIKEKPSKRFSIIVVHRNGAQRLLDFLKSVKLAINIDQDEVIVVDNHSSDDSIENVQSKYPFIQVINNNCNAGYAHACNQGIQKSFGEYILICNNDLELSPNILDQFIADFNQNPNAGLIGGQLLASDDSLSRSAGNATTFYTELGFKSKRKPIFDANQTNKVGAVVGACMAIRRETILDAGSLDDDFFFYYEETEWCVRIRRHGWDVLFDPRIRITHTGGASTQSYFKAARIEFFRSRLLYWKKTLPRFNVLILYLFHIPKLLFDSFIYLILTTLTLGKNKKLKYKLADKSLMLSWVLLGFPKSWGLPDKPSNK
jgi:hypothetical protein